MTLASRTRRTRVVIEPDWLGACRGLFMKCMIEPETGSTVDLRNACNLRPRRVRGRCRMAVNRSGARAVTSPMFRDIRMAIGCC